MEMRDSLDEILNENDGKEYQVFAVSRVSDEYKKLMAIKNGNTINHDVNDLPLVSPLIAKAYANHSFASIGV